MRIPTSALIHHCTLTAVALLAYLCGGGTLLAAPPEQEDFGTLIFEDRFERNEADENIEQPGNGWSTNSKARAKGNKQVDLKNGAFHFWTHPEANHAVSVRRDVEFTDGTVQLRFRFDDKTDSFKLNFADPKEKSVWAGHLVHVVISPQSVVVTDRKTGSMNLKIRAANKEKSLTPSQKKMLRGKEKIVKLPVSIGEWHDASVTILGANLEVRIDNLPVLKFASQGIAHPTKRMLRLASPTKATIDDLMVFRRDPRKKIAVMETAFSKRGDATSFTDAREAGYRAIQMHSGQPTGMKPGKIDPTTTLAIGSDKGIVRNWNKAAQSQNVQVISLCAGSLNKCQIWDRDREVAMRIAKQTIDGCRASGVNVMLFPFFGPSNFQTSDEAFAGVADFMKELLPYAEQKNVVIGIEAPVTTERVVELLEHLEFPDHLKIYYDTGNLFEKEDIYATIRKYGAQHFCEVHIKAASAAIAGEGKIDLKELAAALDDAHYSGWLVYEANRSGKDPVGNRTAIEKLVSLRARK